jgi:hypothetical protein
MIMDAFMGTGRQGIGNSITGGLVFEVNELCPDTPGHFFPVDGSFPWPSSTWPTASVWTANGYTVNTDAGNIPTATNARLRLTNTGNVTLTNSNYSHLTHLHVEGNLVISSGATLNLSNIQYLYVRGNLTINVNANVNFSSLRKAYVGEKLIISSGATLRGIAPPGISGDYGTDFLIRGNRLRSGTNFSYSDPTLTGYSLFVHVGTTILNCRFYVQGGDIGFGQDANGVITTNSVFVATMGSPKTASGKIHVGTAGRSGSFMLREY